MSLINPNLHVPMEVRQRLGIPGGVMSVEFGQSSPLDGTGGFNYELSPEDRHIIERAAADAKSGDPTLAESVFRAIKSAASFFPPAKIAVLVGEFVWNILGKIFRGEGALGGIAHSCRGTGIWGDMYLAESQNLISYLTNAKLNVVERSGTRYIEGYTKTVTQVLGEAYLFGFTSDGYNGPNLGSSAGRMGIYGSDSAGNPAQRLAFALGTSGAGSGGRITNPPVTDRESFLKYLRIQFPGSFPENGRYEHQNVDISVSFSPGDPLQICSYDVKVSASGVSGSPDVYTLNGCKDLPTEPGEAFDFDGSPDLTGFGMDPGDFGDPSKSNLNPEEARQFAEQLRDTPWWDQYGTPFSGEHPKDPNWPCNPGSANPIPGEDLDRGIINPGPGGGFQIKQPGPLPDFPGDKFNPGDELCFVIDGKKVCGKIGRYEPPGDIIGKFPPYPDEYFTKPRCFKNKLAVDIVRILAEELGLKPDISWIIDVGCKKRFTGCFNKGTSKFEAMWAMADLCGYGIFPDPGTPGIAPIKPLPIHHGPYHEHRDLFVFNPAKDDLDIPSHVEIWRPHERRRRGYSVVARVDVPYDLKDKWYSELAPRGTSAADAMDIAATKANQFRQIATYLEFAIPFNDKIKARHQIKCQIPSAGFTANYMAWEIEHDIDVNEGSITVIRGIELKRWRYAPRFDDWNTVWANSGIIK